MTSSRSNFLYRLHYALEDSDCPMKVIKTLIESEYTDVNLFDGRGQQPIHIAVSNSHTKREVFNLLILKGADIDAKNDYLETPLHIAVKESFCRLDIVEELLAQGANVNAKDSFDNTPLHNAARNYNYDINVIQALLDKGADVKGVNYIGDNPLQIALKNPKCDVNIVQLLIKGVDINSPNFSRLTPLITYLQNRNCRVEVVRELINHGAILCERNPSAMMNALHYAVTTPHSYAVLSAILNKLSKFTVCCNIIDIINEGDYQLNTPLHSALEVTNVDEKVILLLLEYGANVNIRNKAYDTPLLIATKATNCNLAAIQMLLESGASVYDFNIDDGYSPFSCMIEKYNTDPMNYKSCTWLMVKYAVKHCFEHYLEQDFQGFKLIDELSIGITCENSKTALKKFIRKCCKELVRMKTDMVTTDISLYNFISDNKLKVDCKNREMREIIVENVLITLGNHSYPIYYSLIANCFDRSELQKVILKRQIHTTCVSNAENKDCEDATVELVPECVRNIMVYLCKVDLINFALTYHESICLSDKIDNSIKRQKFH